MIHIVWLTIGGMLGKDIRERYLEPDLFPLKWNLQFRVTHCWNKELIANFWLQC